MTVENTTTIDGLNITLPAATDRLIEGDDHLRQLKLVEKNIFSGVNGDGFNTPILATESDLNNLQGLVDDIETQLQTLRNGETPIGGIQFYNGLLSAIPPRFFLCDGLNGTPNLSEQFVLSGGTEASLGVTGGSADDVVISHTHTADHDHTGSSAIAGDHTHLQAFTSTTSGGSTTLFRSFRVLDSTAKTLLGGLHFHSATMSTETINTTSSGVSPIGTNIPRYYKAAYIMRVS